MITEPTDEQLEKWGRKAMQIRPAGVAAKQPEPTPDKREEDRLRKVAAANGDRIVKNKIDQSYQLVDVATGRVVWPTHIGTTRIGATFKELRRLIYGVTI